MAYTPGTCEQHRRTRGRSWSLHHFAVFSFFGALNLRLHVVCSFIGFVLFPTQHRLSSHLLSVQQSLRRHLSFCFLLVRQLPTCLEASFLSGNSLCLAAPSFLAAPSCLAPLSCLAFPLSCRAALVWQLPHVWLLMSGSSCLAPHVWLLMSGSSCLAPHVWLLMSGNFLMSGSSSPCRAAPTCLAPSSCLCVWHLIVAPSIWSRTSCSPGRKRLASRYCSAF
jgi:hypothetical protein